MTASETSETLATVADVRRICDSFGLTERVGTAARTWRLDDRVIVGTGLRGTQLARDPGLRVEVLRYGSGIEVAIFYFGASADGLRHTIRAALAGTSRELG